MPSITTVIKISASVKAERAPRLGRICPSGFTNREKLATRFWIRALFTSYPVICHWFSWIGQILVGSSTQRRKARKGAKKAKAERLKAIIERQTDGMGSVRMVQPTEKEENAGLTRF